MGTDYDTVRLLLAVAGTLLTTCALPAYTASAKTAGAELQLIPYPQEVKRLSGTLTIGPPNCETDGPASDAEKLANKTLGSYLPKKGNGIRVRLGSVEEGYEASWLSADEKALLEDEKTSPEASILRIEPSGITVVGKGKWGMVYGAQTVNQLAVQAAEEARFREKGLPKQLALPCLAIRDWPDMKWRCLSPTMTWYSGYNRLEGYDLCNWTLDEWKWLVDWSLLHKYNGWAMCMYGNWPFTLPGYPETTLDVDSFFYDPITRRKTPWRFIHKNIKKEFLPELIRYANERGVEMYAYIGKNSFNGTYGIKHPETNAGGAAELIPFAPGVHDYWNAFIKRILEIGFNGFVFEDPEANHVPNQNQQCYDTFWKPWAEKYGIKSMAETNRNNPPLGVQVEYYSWLFKEFDSIIQKNASQLGRAIPDIYLISHVLLSRMVSESKTQKERDEWFAYIDEKQGRKVPFIILEADEKKYVDFLGKDRVASLGGRGGSCGNAMRRIASINNNWSYGPMGMCLDYERKCQKNIYEAGGFGAMGYVFEWTNTEVFGYLGSQYLWRNSGVPYINNDNQTDFLYYSYKMCYGEKVGIIAAKAHDEGPAVNDAMVLEEVNGSQWPSTGAALHRDYQMLARLSDHGLKLATKAYKLYTGKEPDLYKPAYKQEDYRWNGFDLAADKQFKAERLRLLCVSMKRSQLMSECALAHRKAQMLIAQGASAGAILEQYDRSIKAARENQHVYSLNYDDDYDWTDGLCSKLTGQLLTLRSLFLAGLTEGKSAVKKWTFDQPGDLQGWTEVNSAPAPTVENGALVVQSTGSDSFMIHAEPMSVPVNDKRFLEFEMSSDQAGQMRIFWRTKKDAENDHPKAYAFSEARVAAVGAIVGSKVYRVMPKWDGVLTDLRIGIPANAKVRFDSIRIVEIPATDEALTGIDLKKPIPESMRKNADRPLFIPWEKMSDIVPKQQAARKPGLYLSTDIGMNQSWDVFNLGVVFTVQAEKDGKWETVFRRALERRFAGWEHWDIPIQDKNAKVRFITDSYSRAQDRNWPTWKWALWGQPQLIEIASDGKREVKYDFVSHIDQAEPIVRLDADGKDRPFDAKTEDSTGATFKYIDEGAVARLKAGEGKNWQWVDGFADWAGAPPNRGGYKNYLGTIDSGWAYSEKNEQLSWSSKPVAERKDTAVAFIGGTGYAPGKAELWCGGKMLIVFDMAKTADMKWEQNGAELRFIFGGDTRDEKTPFGISGVYVLRLPASMVTPGKPLNLTVKTQPGQGEWFMVHGYADTEAVTRGAVMPNPPMPAIAAFTPHLNGHFGVTIAEYDLGESY